MTEVDFNTTPCVYALQASEGSMNLKIGHTKNVISRMSAIQGGSDSDLKLIATIPANSKSEAVELEGIIHSALSEYRIRGEWFDSRCVAKLANMGFVMNRHQPNKRWIKRYKSDELLKIRSLVARDVLEILLDRVIAERSNDVIVEKKHRQAIGARLCGVTGSTPTDRTIQKALTVLFRHGIVDRLGKGKYRLNKDYFFYGKE